MSRCENAVGSPRGSAPTKTQEPGAATIVSTAENIIARTRANAPPNDALLHGRGRLCRSCGCETASGDGICPDCADAIRAEEAEGLAERCRVYRTRYVEDLSLTVLEEFQRERGRV